MVLRALEFQANNIVCPAIFFFTPVPDNLSFLHVMKNSPEYFTKAGAGTFALVMNALYSAPLVCIEGETGEVHPMLQINGQFANAQESLRPSMAKSVYRGSSCQVSAHYLRTEYMGGHDCGLENPDEQEFEAAVQLAMKRGTELGLGEARPASLGTLKRQIVQDSLPLPQPPALIPPPELQPALG